MSKQRVNWFRVAVILALAAAILWISIILGKSPIGYALGQSAPPRVSLPTQLEGMGNMTWVIPLDKTHPLCWSDGNTPTMARAIRFYRYRVEGGPKQLYTMIPNSLWVAQPTATNYCAAGSHKVPKAGHWVYEAEICWLPIAADNSNCSVRVSASCPAGTAGCAGSVAGIPRGWWVYAYLPAPSGPVVN